MNDKRKMRRLLVSEDDYQRLLMAAKTAGLVPAPAGKRMDSDKVGVELLLHKSVRHIEDIVSDNSDMIPF